MEQIQKQVAARKLLEVSEVEQTLSCSHDHAKAAKMVAQLLEDPQISGRDALKLVALYHLRYEKESANQYRNFLASLRNKNLSTEEMHIIDNLITYAGADQRACDLFENKNWIQIARGQIKLGLYGVTNIYTQHDPLLKRLLDELIKGKLRENLFPYADGAPSKDRPNQIIIFVVGGIAYEEAVVVHQLNELVQGVSIVLGGTSVLNSDMMLDLLNSTPIAKR
eukprot:TRINITY_DN9138_c0_g1_i1.p1 TRINITY_DN9138_c0_g1~~TRINITY_DN9138_c0_g1_i1.p1  ORF type:complete len:253 (+),score=52.73 TRINITY_DN9138_c0_g1_i1:93-761(+)